jgi:MoxR-like ATPase
VELSAEQKKELEVVERFHSELKRIDGEVRKIIVGQNEVVEQVMMTLLAGGNSMITGVPGLAKTLLIATVAQVLNLNFKRIQFTPDLMPADITGGEIIEEDRSTGKRERVFVKGPIFANIILADEINRTPPKTQSALLEAMQERSVTVEGKTYILDKPFFVLATQNPIELEGTYPLPEAQLDRFMFNIIIEYLTEDEEIKVVDQTTTVRDVQFEKTIGGPEIIEYQKLVRKMPVAEPITRYAVQLARMSRPSGVNPPGTRLELAMRTRGAHSWVRSTPTGLPDWTSRVSSSPRVTRVRQMASNASQLRAARPVPP